MCRVKGGVPGCQSIKRGKRGSVEGGIMIGEKTNETDEKRQARLSWCYKIKMVDSVGTKITAFC